MTEPVKIDALKAKFVAEFGDDPQLWERFVEYVSTGAQGVYKEKPVGVEEFFTESYFCGATANTLFPAVMEALKECASGQYVEAVLTGGIGCSKTTIALCGTMYSVYQLSLMWQPQKEFGLIPTDEIVFAFQSITGATARNVDFNRFSAMVHESRYFMERFRPKPFFTAELHFPNRVYVRPLSGNESSAIGQNIFGGLIDEVNYMSVVENSKLSADGGVYDQAQALYDSIRRRRESRFMNKGNLPGILFLASSKRYPGEFTERKQDEARREIAETGKTKIYVYDKRSWEVNPEKFNDQRFDVFIGDETRQPRVIEQGEHVPEEDRSLIMAVPLEYKTSFENDILSALRDVGGVSTMALHPFIMSAEKIAASFGKAESVLSVPACDFVATKVAIHKPRFIRPQEPRFVHIDLSIRGDSSGVACGFVPKFVELDRGADGRETLPVIQYDFILEVRPPRNGEIVYEKIRVLLYKLRELGMNIRWVTLDSFQSRDTIQILRQRGFLADLQSVDVTSLPYVSLKSAILDGRIIAPAQDKARRELVQLEQDGQTGKVDHPPNGSKDLADAMAGVAHGLFTRREIWAKHGMLSRMPKAVSMSETQSSARKAG